MTECDAPCNRRSETAKAKLIERGPEQIVAFTWLRRWRPGQQRESETSRAGAFERETQRVSGGCGHGVNDERFESLTEAGGIALDLDALGQMNRQGYVVTGGRRGAAIHRNFCEVGRFDLLFMKLQRTVADAQEVAQFAEKRGYGPAVFDQSPDILKAAVGGTVAAS